MSKNSTYKIGSILEKWLITIKKREYKKKYYELKSLHSHFNTFIFASHH